jgi:N-succinyldiaminopimelate aminotransferase
VFAADPERLKPYVRFAFCKRLTVIDAAAAKLSAIGAAASG